jgi:protein SCO1/2
MIKRKWIFSLMGIIAVLWIGVIAAAKWIQHGLNRDHTSAAAVAMDEPDATNLKIYWDVPAFSFRDQDGKITTNRDLLGHVWVADFIFTQCTSACPILTSKLMLLQKKLPMPGVRFVSFSVDPEHDTPAALKAYAKLWEGDESRWRLLSTDPAGLAKITEGMKVTATPSGDPENPILHSNLFFLIDKTGKVRGIYNSGESEAMSRLEEDLRLLAGDDATMAAASSTSAPDVARGKQLFGSMGCLACHTRRAIAPPLESLYGSMVRLDDHRMVWADEAYLHESIVDPAAKIVAGYTKSMPSYRNYLSDPQIMDLMAYIKSLSSNQPGGHGILAAAATSQSASDELLIDPVCKMQVRPDPDGPHAVFNGKTYYFCSDNCLQKFLHTPANYAATSQPAK